MMSGDKPLVLSAAATHDLKNQLGIVLGFIELLIEDTPESDPRRADLLEVREGAQACLKIITASSADTNQ